MHEYLRELNGYLNALGKLCGQTGWRYGFRVQQMDIETDVDQCLKMLVTDLTRAELFDGKRCELVEKVEIDYVEFNRIMTNAMLSHMRFQVSEDDIKPVHKEILWHIHEYLGLMSNDLAGPFSPTASGPMWSVIVDRPDNMEFSYIAVQIKNILVLLALEYE